MLKNKYIVFGLCGTILLTPVSAFAQTVETPISHNRVISNAGTLRLDDQVYEQDGSLKMDMYIDAAADVVAGYIASCFQLYPVGLFFTISGLVKGAPYEFTNLYYHKKVTRTYNAGIYPYKDIIHIEFYKDAEHRQLVNTVDTVEYAALPK